MLPYIDIGFLSVPSYGVCMAAGIIVACLIAYFRLRSRGGNFDSLLLVVAAAVLVGLCCAKIFYYIFSYGLGRLISEALSGDFSGFTDSGIVYYGGLIGGIIGAFAAIKANHCDLDAFLNAIVPCVPLGHAIGRIGCLLGGCCYGVPYDGPLAIHSVYLDPMDTRFPIQAVESLLNIVIFFVLLIYTRKKRNGMVTLSVYLILYSIVRFILEFFRGDLIRGVYWGFSTSQWISALLIIVSAAVIILTRQGRFMNGVKTSGE